MLYSLKQIIQAIFDKVKSSLHNDHYGFGMLIAAAVYSLPFYSFAQEPVVQAITEDIEFGVIPSNRGICRMNRRGRLLGLAGQDCVGDGRSAHFRVTGIANSVINVQTSGSQDGNVQFTPRINGSATKNLGGNGRQNVFVFGDLQIAGQATGSYSLGYVLNINYE